MLSGRYLAEKVISELGVKTIYSDINGKTFFGKLSELEKATLKFQKDITVTKGNLIEVKFRHSDPSVAAKVVNKLIEDFLDYYLAVQRQSQKYDFFKKQVNLIGKGSRILKRSMAFLKFIIRVISTQISKPPE